MNEMLVIGYCKRIEIELMMSTDNENIYIPLYLKRIVVKYYPPFFLDNNN